ncbi:NUDIX domain-containing protein [Georgenia sp. 10Sc9-8]|uniref:NUDIX domain-containing protein n=1 Tax=Georgenia halotolerans TaxID=3028317 RepID=A0ABT5TZH7_9MICO|nr:NUDIX domain-containing protein [Georgenia halotolerans]
MTDRFQVVPAAYLLLRRGSEVLLQLRQNTGYRDGHWACGAAGHVESGESALAAVVREAREELGVEVRTTDLQPVTTVHRTHGNGRAVDERVDFFFQCHRWQGEPVAREPDRCAELRWVDLHELPEPVVPHEAAVLDVLGTGSVPAILVSGFDAAPR